MMLLISSFDIINVIERLLPNPNTFLCIPASAADAAAVYPKGINTLLANGLIIFDIKGNPVFSNGPSNVLKNPDCIILDNRVFDNLILADELFAKAFRRFKTCLLANNNL